ncbi:hypothetical protein Hanom_Chr08g00698471 [Helianthus anomalus]
MRYMFVSTQELWLNFFLMKITFFLPLQIAHQVRSITKSTNLYSSVLLCYFYRTHLYRLVLLCKLSIAMVVRN